MSAQKEHRRGGKQHNLLRGSHYDDTKKYEKQRVRTALNKAKRVLQARALKKAADTRRADARLARTSQVFTAIDKALT